MKNFLILVSLWVFVKAIMNPGYENSYIKTVIYGAMPIILFIWILYFTVNAIEKFLKK